MKGFYCFYMIFQKKKDKGTELEFLRKAFFTLNMLFDSESDELQNFKGKKL